ncbi:RECQ1-like protein [Mya arenaria]|uniref:DNA 3'-5' helicase n=1 Tax=Mya arenaria TaxID=6604 RepID=A0ABY7EIK6_MYAAR|nr:RECQ1-like protein [Mya arenaria]WAR09518.1 RECQ1-like protein [Mya arenaria]
MYMDGLHTQKEARLSPLQVVRVVISKMDVFDSCLHSSLQRMNISFKLREEQKQCLENVFNLRDTIAVLPTGFGKSLIFQLLPCLMQEKLQRQEPMIVVIVTPLNSIMEDQVSSLKSKVISACFLSYDGCVVSTFDDGDDEVGNTNEEDAEGKVRLPTSMSLSDLKNGCSNLIYAHPEALQSKEIMKILHSRTYQERVCAIVVDEAHMVGDEFRPSFKRLGELTCIFPKAGHIALTATATPTKIKDLAAVLQYSSECVISLNPDRPNIYLEVLTRPPNVRKYEKYDSLINPISKELCEKLVDFPVTIMYMESLEALGYCYQYVSHDLKEKQYTGEAIPENRIFAQYHTDYTQDMKRHIVNELTKETPKLRLVMATVALGMGLNAPSVTRIIHCRPPTTLEEYLQEMGRAGRKGQQAEAILYYNNSDISKSRKGMSQSMISYCKNEQTCLRLQLVQHFGFNHVVYSGESIKCCSNCKRVFSRGLLE